MGALPEQTAEFGFGGGLSQKEDSWLSSSGFGTLHNCVQDKTGALAKHLGYNRFPVAVRNGDKNVAVTGLLMDVPNGSIGDAPRLVKRGDQIAAIDSSGLLYAKTDKWTLQGRVAHWVCEQRSICQTDGERHDCCCSGDWIYTAHELASGGVRVVATYVPSNETTTLFTGGNIPTSGINEPRIVAIDTAGTALLFYMSGTQGKYHVVTPDGVSTAQNVTLNTGYDVVSDPAGHQIWTAYFTTILITSDNYTFASGTITLHATTSQSGLSNCQHCTLAVDVANNRMAYCWVEYLLVGGGPNADTAVRVISRSLDYSTAYFTVKTVWTSPSPSLPGGVGELGIALSPFDGWLVVFTSAILDKVIGKWIDLIGNVVGNGGPSGAGDIVAPCVHLRSRPAWDPVAQRMFFLADSSTLGFILAFRSRGHLILGIEPRSTAGKAAPQLQRFGVLGAFSYLTAGSIAQSFGRISRPFQDANGVWHVQGVELGGQAATLQLLTDYALVADDRVGAFAELGRATYIVGAVLSQWDGTRVCESTFTLDPSIGSGSTTTTGGSLSVGTYVYALTYARITSSGEIVRSRPSVSVSANVIAPNNAVVLPINSPGPSNLTDQDNQTGVAFVEVWRSERNTTSPLYLATRVAADLTQSANLSFTDTTNSNLGKEQLYSDGTNGEIANSPAASPLSLCQWRNRLWMTDGEQIFYTKEAAATRAAEWSQAFFAIPRGGPGRLAAVAPLGETLIVFGEESTSYIYGDGPGANGDGSTLVGPMPAITELGCTQPGGIGQLPTGLLVPTRRGLQFLNGKREFEYIGAAIEDTLALFPRVRCARHIGGTDRVWIALAAQDLSAGIGVLLDTHHKTFSTVFANTEISGLNMVPCSSIDLNGAHTFSTNDGNAFDQTPANYLVNGQRYGQQIETPWFKASGPSGELRARRFILLMKRIGVSGLLIEIAYDYSDTYSHSFTYTNIALAAMEGQPDTLKPRIPFPRQRCQSYRMRFTEIPAVAGLGGFRFVSLRMSISLRPGSGRLLSKANSGLPGNFT